MDVSKFLKVARGPRRSFSESFKRMVVMEFEQGFMSKDQLQIKYGLRGNAQVLKWCRIYGKFAYPKQTNTGRPMKDPQKQRIKELEARLKAAELKVKVYEKLIEVTNRELDQDVLKKIEARLSASGHQPEV